MIVGLALLAFCLSFLPVLVVQRALARSAAGLVLTSLVQVCVSSVAIWAMLRHAGERMGEASGYGVMIAFTIPGLGIAMILNGLVGLWFLVRIWKGTAT